MDTEQELHSKMKKRDTLLGALGGAGLGALATRSRSGIAQAAGPIAGALAGGLAGHTVGSERAAKDTLKQERHLADREQAQEHRKELVTMRKKAHTTFDGAVLAAMADELQHMKKVAINLAPVGNMLGSLGSKALTGVTSLATKAGPGIGGAVSKGLMAAGQMAGGGANLSKLVGGGLVAAGGLGAASAASRMMRPQQRAY